MKKYLKCKETFYYKKSHYFEVGKIYLWKQASFNQNAYVVGGRLVLKKSEIQDLFIEVDENDKNKILCIKDYYHNINRYYTEGFDYYLHEIIWEKGVVYLSSNFHNRIETELSIIKEHFDLTHIYKIEKRKNIIKSLLI